MDGKFIIFVGAHNYEQTIETLRKLFAEEAENRGIIVISGGEMNEQAALSRLYRHFESSEKALDQFGVEWAITDDDLDVFKKEMRELNTLNHPTTLMIGNRLVSSGDLLGFDEAKQFPLEITSMPVEYYKFEDDLKERREWNKLEPKQYDKDRNFNPNRVHANCHSSKVNNRERSRKKRKSKKKGRY